LFPLVATAAGTKFGKTESGAVWLDAKLTTPYKFYQFWINADDRDVGRYLRFFTLLSRDEVAELDSASMERPEKREAQRALARDVTARVHGAEAVRAAEEVSGLLFGGLDPAALSIGALEALQKEIPYYTSGSVEDAQSVITAVTSETGLFKSRGDAKRMIQQGGVYLNGQRVEGDAGGPVSLLHGRFVLVRKGGKNYALVEKAD
jgi:tyrosyl-tRNA synthetase